MKIIYVFPAIVAAAAIFSGACQKGDQSSPPEKGSAPSTASTKEASPGTDAPTEKKVSAKTKIDHVSARQAAEFIEKNPDTIIIDVRTPDEFATGHIKGSINIDFKASSFQDKLKSLDPNQTYIIHCRSGGRSSSSLGSFRKIGFQHIIHLDGGMMDWGKEELPVEK